MPERMYRFGIFSLILGTFVVIFSVFLRLYKSIILTFLSTSTIFGAVLLAIAFVIESILFLRANWENPVLKISLALAASSSATYSLIQTNNLINIHTKIDPSHLPIATSIITIFFTLLSWIKFTSFALLMFYILAIVLFFVMIILGPFLPTFFAIKNSYFFRYVFRNQQIEDASLWSKNVIEKVNLWLSRSAAATIIAILLLFSSSLIDSYVAYDQTFSQVLTKIIVWSNYMPSSDECVNHKPDEKLVVINNRKISVATPNTLGGYTFQVRSCDPAKNNSVG